MFLKKLFKGNTTSAAVKAAANIYEFKAVDIDGREVELSKYK